jgi:hypothetical protein
VAVLGARRPGVGAWNFVVAGLLAVLFLPVAEGFGTPRLNPPHLAFLTLVLVVPVLNYLPTRLGLAAAAVGFACAVVLARLDGVEVGENVLDAAGFALASAPWLGAWGFASGRSGDPFDRTWRRFRDAYGFIWAQRVREQFNRAAVNAGWPVFLRWGGLEASGPRVDPEAFQAMLGAVLKRFGIDDSATQ